MSFPMKGSREKLAEMGAHCAAFVECRTIAVGVATSSTRFSRKCAGLLAGTRSTAIQVEIPNPIVRRAAVPHPSLRVAEQFPNRILGMRERVFGNLAGFRIEPPEHIHVIRRIPDVVIRVDPDSIWKYVFAARQVVFLERFSLRVKPADLAILKFAKPHDATRIEFDSPLVPVLCRNVPLLDLERLPIHFSDLARAWIRKPDISVLVRFESVRVIRDAPEIRKFSCLRIQPAQGISS